MRYQKDKLKRILKDLKPKNPEEATCLEEIIVSLQNGYGWFVEHSFKRARKLRPIAGVTRDQLVRFCCLGKEPWFDALAEAVSIYTAQRNRPLEEGDVSPKVLGTIKAIRDECLLRHQWGPLHA